jgi:hypothetical protein
MRKFLSGYQRMIRAGKRKVDRVTANHSLSSTASQETSNIPFPCFLVLVLTARHKDGAVRSQDTRKHGRLSCGIASWESFMKETSIPKK